MKSLFRYKLLKKGGKKGKRELFFFYFLTLHESVQFISVNPTLWPVPRSAIIQILAPPGLSPQDHTALSLALAKPEFIAKLSDGHIAD